MKQNTLKIIKFLKYIIDFRLYKLQIWKNYSILKKAHLNIDKETILYSQ